jgi:cytochrome b561
MAGAADPLSFAALRYSRVAMWFHWTIAALIIANLLLGFLRDDVSRPAAAAMIYYHKATGLAILGLSLGRLLWRLTHRPPQFDPVLARWETMLARAAHWLFYVLNDRDPDHRLTGRLLGQGRSHRLFRPVRNPGAAPIKLRRRA